MKLIKHPLLIAFIAFFPMTILSQNFTFNYDIDSIDYAQPGNTITVHATISNLTANDLTLDIVRNENNIPSGWGTSMCIDVCLPPHVNSSVLYLPAYNTQGFTMYFYTDSIQSIGQTLIQVSNQSDASQFVSLKFYGETSSTASIDDYVEYNKLFNVFPNPTSDKIEITSNSDMEIRAIQVVSITGEIILTTKDRVIFLNELKVGTYFIIIETEDKFFTQKIIKQ